MANIALKGFQPVRVFGNDPITYSRGRVLTNNTTAIFLWDAVVLTSAGDYIVQATGTTATSNVACGAIFTDTNGVYRENKFLPAATLYTSTGVNPQNASYIFVTEQPVNTEFLCSISTAVAITDLNNNFPVSLGAGSTATGLSGHFLTATGQGTTATIPWRFRDFVFGADSDPDLLNAHVYAQINAGMADPALSLSVGT